ncbi:hypothetical protein HO173_000667 [Letharia columbiana]|uniref:Cytochrome b-c1 complex subunit 10 n=1 Tax=Letharia columbiana TaxID=112416 RepID=A0A8H6L9L9_9LECA|nr:uncharacterized protein HO173_000667 [Letharia columbiana]KAF6240875.1 hypothetical protein HO173_000667 [Letharia columbiana]
MSIMYPLGCCRAWEAEVEVKGYIDLDHRSIVATDTVVERLHGPLSSQMFKQQICSSGRSLGPRPPRHPLRNLKARLRHLQIALWAQVRLPSTPTPSIPPSTTVKPCTTNSQNRHANDTTTQLQNPTQPPGHRARASLEIVRADRPSNSPLLIPCASPPRERATEWSGMDLLMKGNSGITLGSFGVVGAIFALQFFAEVPKVRKDILQKFPVIGDYFVREIPPSDNPF